MSFKEEEKDEPAAVPNAANRPTKMKNEQDHRNWATKKKPVLLIISKWPKFTYKDDYCSLVYNKIRKCPTSEE